MQIRDLIPWNRPSRVPVRSVFGREDASPILALHREIERAFDQFWTSFGGNGLIANGYGVPAIDVAETDEAFEVTAELPGLDESDIDVSVTLPKSEEAKARVKHIEVRSAA